ncbi:MAG: redox-regulated ATPase YchF [Candidatus Marinimicrobia bacterium]|nr:redox-regulated ATPase YchF [Candidatus Neomarinimicrobiota bacterium]
MQTGIVGLPFSGKSTLFQTLLSNKADSAEFKKKHLSERGIINVYDKRLDRLTALFNPRSKVHATIEYIKVPGLDPQNENGLSPQFFANLKTVDEIILVVRGFEDEIYPHPSGKVDPRADIEFALAEFLLSDMLIVEKRIERLEKQLKKVRNVTDERELQLLLKCQKALEEGKALRTISFNDEELKQLKGYQFLSSKPRLIVINIDESQLSSSEEVTEEYRDYQAETVSVMSLCLKIESEIAELDEADQEMFLEELGISEPALYRLVQKSYDLLGLISFFTVGEDECRSWSIHRGMNAQQAAGVIHSDLERGFIRADVVSNVDLLKQGSLAACRSRGLLRLEGKDYNVKDGDVMEIRFNV